MSLLKVIVFLLIFSIVLIDSRALRKRRQQARSSAYYGTNGLSVYPYISYTLSLAGLEPGLYPIGNNWYVQGGPPYPYNGQFGYNMQQQPYMSNYGYANSYNTFNTGQYAAPGFYSQYPVNNGEAYTGQSYVPQSSEWLPLPGRDRRRRSLRSAIIPNIIKSRTLNKQTNIQ